MRKCRHLAAFDISYRVVDQATSGLPPWGAVCEDCASTIVEVLRLQLEKIASSHPSGKSSSAQTWARIRRLLGDWEALPENPTPADDGGKRP